jgi:hypothetical protein
MLLQPLRAPTAPTLTGGIRNRKAAPAWTRRIFQRSAACSAVRGSKRGRRVSVGTAERGPDLCRLMPATLTGHRQNCATLTGHRQDRATLTGHRQERATLTGRRQDRATLTGHRQDRATLTGHRQNRATLTGRRQNRPTQTGHGQKRPTQTGPRQNQGCLWPSR